MAAQDDDELARQAEETAKANIAAAKHMKVIATTLPNGMAKEVMTAQAARPEKAADKTQAQIDYEARQRQEQNRAAILDRARAIEPVEVVKAEQRRDNQQAVADNLKQSAPHQIAQQWAAERDPKQAAKDVAEFQAKADQATPLLAAAKLAELRREAERLQAAHDVTHPDGATVQRTQQRRDAAQAITARLRTLREQGKQQPAAPPQPAVNTQMLLPSERLRLLREQGNQATISAQVQRDLEAQHRARLGTDRFAPLRGETSDRMQAAEGRAARQETSDRAAREATRELSSDETEARQSRRNNGKRGKDNERDV